MEGQPVKKKKLDPLETQPEEEQKKHSVTVSLVNTDGQGIGY